MRGHSDGYGSSTSFSSYSTSSTDHGEVTVVAEKRQVTPSLVDFASSAERLSKLSVTGDHAKPVSSTLAHDRSAAIVTAHAVADARHEASIRRACVTLDLKDVARISTLPFPPSGSEVAGA